MNRNPLLSGALVMSRIGRALLLAGMAAIVILFIHWQMNPDAYRHATVSFGNGDVAISEGKKAPDGGAFTPAGAGDGKTFYLNDLNPFSVWINFFQLLFSLLAGWLIAGEAIRILRSVKALRTFNDANVRSFRRLGYLCLALLLINCLRFAGTAQTSGVSFHINFGLLLFMLIAFILAEIFREGQRLYEQEQLTI